MIFSDILRVDNVECHVYKVGHHMQVTLWSTTTRIFVEGFLLCEPEQQQLQVMHGGLMTNVSVTGGFL